MIIEKVELRNFRSHLNSEVHFDRGINVIIGENGAGKTSILEAINFSLFGKKTPMRINISELTTRGAEDEGMEVSLTFQANAKKFRVTRGRGKTNTDKLYQDEALLTGDEKEGQTTKEIEKNIHMDAKLFSNSVYIKQGEIDALISLEPAKRKALIGKLIGTEDLEIAWDEMRGLINEYEDRIEGDIPRDIKEAEGSLVAHKEEIKEYGTRLKEIDGTIHEKAGALESSKTKVRSLKELSDARILYERLATDYRTLKEALDSKNRALEERFLKASSILQKKVENYGELEEVYNERKTALEGEREALTENAMKIKGRWDEKRAVEAEVKKAVSELRKAEDKCPVCGSKLDEKHKERVFKEYQDELSKLGEAMNGLEEELKGYQEKLEGMEKRLKCFEQVDLREIKSFGERKEELEGNMAKLEGELGDIRDSFTEKTGKLGLKELGELSWDERFSRVGEILGSLEKAVEDISREISDLREQWGRMETGKNMTEKAVQELEEKLKELKAKERENEKLTRFVAFLKKLRLLFDKDHLQKELRIRHKPRIEKYTREHFDKFNLPYTDICLTEDYNITVFDTKGEKNADMLSGGEKIAAALALRFGIANDLLESASAMELIILDEPTIHLDEQRRLDLVEIVKKLSSIPQTIVVTHDREFESAADKLILVQKSDGASCVDYRGG
ncbi:MAG: AAA family ATPase [Candidatus Hydrothermarchaeales archaeon]